MAVPRALVARPRPGLSVKVSGSILSSHLFIYFIFSLHLFILPMSTITLLRSIADFLAR